MLTSIPHQSHQSPIQNSTRPVRHQSHPSPVSPVTWAIVSLQRRSFRLILNTGQAISRDSFSLTLLRFSRTYLKAIIRNIQSKKLRPGNTPFQPSFQPSPPLPPPIAFSHRHPIYQVMMKKWKWTDRAFGVFFTSFFHAQRSCSLVRTND